MTGHLEEEVLNLPNSLIDAILDNKGHSLLIRTNASFVAFNLNTESFSEEHTSLRNPLQLSAAPGLDNTFLLELH